MATQVFTKITQNSPPLSFYPAAQRVTYLYYLGRFHFINNHFGRAARCLQEAYAQTPPSFQKHRQLILTYLIPCNMLLGRLPSAALLGRPEARPLAPVFTPFARAVRTGDFIAFQRAAEAHEAWLFRRGLLLTLTYRLRPLLWRSFSRRVFLITYVAPPAITTTAAANATMATVTEESEADSRKAATLELSHLLTAAQFVQKRLEGYVVAQPPPSLPPLPPKGRQTGVNPMLLRAVTNQNHHQGPGPNSTASTTTTLVPPPGGPRRLGPGEGLVWGNMPLTAEHVESVVASLVAQGLMHGFIAHSQGRFAVMGARAKGKGAVAAGWPAVAEVVALDDDEPVPGLVRDRDV